MKLVIVARSEEFGRSAVKCLHDFGYQVNAVVNDVHEALDAAQTERPDCLVVEAVLSKDDVKAALDIQRKHICPVVMVSDRPQIKAMTEAIGIGVFGYVTKPLEALDLVAAIEVAAASFRKVERLEKEIASLQGRIETLKLVNDAKAILMKNGLTEQEAFSRMRSTSMNIRRPLREVAEAVVIHARIEE